MKLKKGIIQMVIEIDYDQMIPEENLDAILAYSGEADRDGAMKAHLRVLGESLEKLVKEKPFIAYQLNGEIVGGENASMEIRQSDAVEEDLVTENEIVEEDVEEEVLEEDVTDHEQLVENLENAILEVAMNHGIPYEIKVSGKVHKLIAKSEHADDEMQYYKGYPLILEGMEEDAVIVYRSYINRETGEYVVK